MNPIDQGPMSGLSIWLNYQAQTLDSAPWRNDPQIIKHVATLRTWAQEVEAARDALAGQSEPGAPAKDSGAETDIEERALFNAYWEQCDDASPWLAWRYRARLAEQDASQAHQPPPVLRVLLPTHEEIRAKYVNLPQPPTALERLVFDTTVVDPVQGEALRALLEGRPPVPVVTP